MRYPRKMTVELTAKCNFRCPYCYCVWHEFPQLAGPELDTDGWKGVLDRFAADGVKEILFTGGEVLVRKDLLAIVDYARLRLPSARLTLFTNASRLTEELILTFKERRVMLATSLQGLATYGAMTGTKRRYNRLLRVVARAKELGWPMAVSMTITSANRAEVADMFAAAALSGASAIQLGAMMCEGRGKRHLDLMLARAEWEAVKDEIRKLPNAGVPYSFADEFICTCRDQPSELLAAWAEPKAKRCPAGRSFGVIGPDGTYRICLHALPKGVRL